MKLRIGENIKFLRKAADITQETLAEMLGVSCQSVSRWELGACYPDMELLPAIAEIFRCSADSLLGIDDSTEKAKVDQYLQRFQAAVSKGKIDECITIAREGTAEFPNNYALLNKLMYALFISGDDDGNIPDWKENMEKYDREIIALGERIRNYCPDQEIRLEATARLAFQHMEMGRRDLGRSIYETLPPKQYCRENQIWWGLEEAEKLPFIRSQIRADYESLTEFRQLRISLRLRFHPGNQKSSGPGRTDPRRTASPKQLAQRPAILGTGKAVCKPWRKGIHVRESDSGSPGGKSL